MRKIIVKFSTQVLRKTFLHEYHVKALKAKMVPFAGYDMPVQYQQGVLKEHLQVREKVGIFDVSHMGQVRLYGPQHLDFVELITTGDIRNKKSGESHLCMILDKNAGIIDDTIVTRRDDHVHMVVNGGNKFIDLEHMRELKKKFNLDVDIQYLEDKPLLAIQGPLASKLLSDLIDVRLEQLPFMNMINISRNGIDYQINRCGYTGEDGFEVSVNQENIIQFSENLLQTGIPIFCGLGSRDSLRIEAGLCLHGNEMNLNITPAEAKLMWTVRGDQTPGEKIRYFGHEALQQRLKEGPKIKRIGFIADVGIIRPPLDIMNDKGDVVGYVTSGTYSPIIKKGIGMGYTKSSIQKSGTELFVVQRGQQQKIKLSKLPFVPNKFYKP